MSDENRNFDEDHAVVSEAYRAAAQEKAPSRLDEAVIHSARRAAATNSTMAAFLGWLRPLTFAAVAGLSLVLVLQMTDIGLVTPPVDGPLPGGNPFNEAAVETAERIRELEAESVSPTMMPGENATSAPAQSQVDAGSRISADDRCTEEQMENSGTWWACIKDLERRGLTDAVERELRALLEAFPGFSAPPR